jgi:glycine/D-amino acid oxidase-like deaminating enzyme
MQLWREWLDEAPAHAALAEYERCGTLWIAADDAELALARDKHAACLARGVAAELLDAGALADAEPLLRLGLAGALRVSDDARVYAPRVAARWIADAHADLIRGEVVAIDSTGLRLADGRQLSAALTVLCAGLASQRWLPPGWMLPKKGQLAITQRQPRALTHQLVELGYLAKAHAVDADTLSFNVQPRPGGQILIGSSRQPGRDDSAIDAELLGRMLAGACAYLPSLGSTSVLRCWTGVRPATRDGLPLIGAHPSLGGVWVATGHEGLGITTCLATAELLADQVERRAPRIDAAPFAPARFE